MLGCWGGKSSSMKLQGWRKEEISSTGDGGGGGETTSKAVKLA